MSRTLLERIHNPRNRTCFCAPECWCRRSALGRAVKWWFPGRFFGLHHVGQRTPEQKRLLDAGGGR